MNTSLIKLRPQLVIQTTKRLLSSSSKLTNDKSVDSSLAKKEDLKVIKYDTEKFLNGVSQFSSNQIENVHIETEAKHDVTVFNGVPKEHIEKRRVRIFKQAKNPMQSGTNDTKLWKIEFEARDRWENPLMGWGSTGDPLSNLVIQFSEKEDAISFCVKNGWTFTVDEPQLVKRGKKKTYADNFAWNSRTRNPSK